MKSSTDAQIQKTGRPKKTADTGLMLEVTRLYYDKEMPRLRIAKRLGLDSREVTFLLDEAKRLRLVRIDIMGMAESELERRFTLKYPHVQKAIIIAGPRDAKDNLLPVVTPEQYQRMIRKTGIAAADHLTDLLNQYGNKTVHIGVTGGESILEAVNGMTEFERPNVYVHTTALVGEGRLRKSASHLLPLVNGSLLWNKLGRVPGRIEYATVLPYKNGKPGPEAREDAWKQLDDMAARLPIREVVEAMDQIDIALAGIGMVNPPKTAAPALRSRISMTELLQTVVTPEQLEQEGAVADFSYNMLSATGQPNDKWQFFLSAGHYSDTPGIRFFQKMTTEDRPVIAVAGSTHKVPAIRAALAAKAFSVLVTDEYTALELLEERAS